MEDKDILSLEDIKKFKSKDGASIVELPPFDLETPFIAKVKRPSLLELVYNGTIPNELLATAQELWEGNVKKGDLKNIVDVFKIVASLSLIKPKYEDVKDMLTDEQLLFLFNYSQQGVRAFQPFSEKDRQLYKMLLDIRPKENKPV